MQSKRQYQKKSKRVCTQGCSCKSKKGIHRDDGSKVRFDNNAAVLVDDKGEPVGTRIFGPVTRELRNRAKWKLFASSRGIIMIKKGLKVKVLVGKDKKKEGEVIEIDRSSNRAKVKVIW